MNYEEFKTTLLCRLNDLLPEGITPKFTSVIKNNDSTHEGISLPSGDNAVSPTLYLDNLYSDYTCGTSMDDITRAVIKTISPSQTPAVLSAELTDFASVSPLLGLKLISIERNRLYLKDVPYRPFQDLAMICVIRLKVNDQPAVSTIRYSTLDIWKKTPDEVFTIAMENFLSSPPKLMSMLSFMSSHGAKDISTIPDMYILTNEENYCGAISMANPLALKAIAERIGGSFAIVPSSIHEVLAVSCGDPAELEQINLTVRSVNRDTLSPEDILGDHAYFYDAKTGSISY